MLNRWQQQGLSLIELLITVSLGLLMMAALSSVFSNTLGVNARSLQLSQLHEEATAALELMVSDIRRAGFRSNAHLQVVDPSAASTDFDAALVISQHVDEAANSCILFSYDENQNGVRDEPAELFGYRLRDGQIQRRQAATDCNSSGWQALTSRDMVTISALQFILLEQSVGSLVEQRLALSFVAASPQDPTLQRPLATAVVVRNAR